LETGTTTYSVLTKRGHTHSYQLLADVDASSSG